MPAILVKNAVSRLNNDVIGHISNRPNRPLKESELPFPITIIDSDTNEEVEAQILSFVYIQKQLPEIFALLSENRHAEDCKTDVMIRCDVQVVDELAFYIYSKR